MTRSKLFLLSLAVAAMTAVFGTPNTAAACYECDWQYGCVPSGFGGRQYCTRYQPQPGGDYFCVFSGQTCQWGGVAALDRSDLTPDGTVREDSYEGAVQLAAAEAGETADGRDKTLGCGGVILARAYSAEVAAEMRETSSTILL